MERMQRRRGWWVWLIVGMVLWGSEVGQVVGKGSERPQVASGAALGVNLAELVDYSDEDPFIDVFKISRAWYGQRDGEFDTNESDAIDVDAAGWVRSLTPTRPGARFTRVATIMMVSGDVHNDYAGTYVVRYAGSGTLSYSGASVLSRQPGREVIVVSDASGYVQLRIEATDASNYLRDIHVMRVEYEDDWLAGAVFNPAWLAKLAPFETIRFMDWMRTNGSTQQTFAERPMVDDARYTTELGAPLEVMVALANQQQAAPWFTMPAPANDAYMQAFAAQVHDQLDSDIPVYVEYSNEVWNTGGSFHPQGSYIDTQAAAEFGSAATDEWFTARMNWHGKRTAEMCAIWHAVFADRPGQLVCVLGAQAANTWTAAEALDCPWWRTDPDNERPGQRCQAHGIDAVAIAPYVGSYIGDPAWSNQVRRWSVQTLFAEINTGGYVNDPAPGDWNDPPAAGALTEAIGWMQDYRAQADDLGYRLVAYEAGQHLAGIGAAQSDAALEQLFLAANRDDRMGQLYNDYLAAWQANSPEVMVLFQLASRSSQYGHWGLLEYIEQATSPKYQAVLDAVTPKVTQSLSTTLGSAPVVVGQQVALPNVTDQGLELIWQSLTLDRCGIKNRSVITKVVGGCDLKATQVGSSQYLAFTRTITLSVVPKAPQVLSASVPATITGTLRAALPSVTDQGALLRWGVSKISSQPCRVQMQQKIWYVVGSGAGTCVINAQAGETALYQAFTQTHTLTVTAKLAQSAVPQTSSLAVGSQQIVPRTSAEGLVLRWSVTPKSRCTMTFDDTSGYIHGVALGSCTVIVRTVGNDVWLPLWQRWVLTIY